MFSLNHSFSKFGCVGISLNVFNPKLLIGSNKGFKIIFNEEEWKNILKNQGVIVSYLYSSNAHCDPINIGNITISFEKLNDSPIIKLHKFNSDYLYFARDTIEGLFEIQEIIDYKFQIIKSQEFE